MEQPAKVKEPDSQAVFERRTRPRRATLPSVIITTTERDEILGGLSPGHEETTAQSVLDDNIGFAITSGSNPKRRSKSVEGLYSSARSHQLSPLPWQTQRRRSEEIQYWRDSVILSPSPVIHDEPRSPLEQIEEKPVNEAKSLRHEKGQSQEEDTQVERNTFDFGLLATAMHDQEQVGLEERVVTVEVKLMDLEYAISKLQRQTPSPIEASSKSHIPSKPTQQPKPVVRPFRGLASASSNESVSDVGSQEGPGYSHSEIPSSYPFSTGSPKERKSRPISAATTVRPHGHVQNPPSPAETTTSKNVHRGSLTAITTDHYATLVSLLRREQTARVRLQEQVNELQLQMQQLLSSTPQLANQSWLHHSYQPTKASHSAGYQGHGTEYDETDTDDGYGEVYETPTEQTEFSPRAPYMNLIEGEAF